MVMKMMMTVMCIHKESSLNPNSDTLENDPQQHDSPTVCVIAHQHSSLIFVSFRCRSRKEKFGAHFEIVIVSLFTFTKCCTSEIA
jgi:hypothetical protein